MTYIVNENCIKCKYTDCVEVCPVDCFYEGENMLVIHPDECIDCGVCEPECPVDAIKPDTEPGLEKWLVAQPRVCREVAEHHGQEGRAARRRHLPRRERANSTSTFRPSRVRAICRDQVLDGAELVPRRQERQRRHLQFRHQAGRLPRPQFQDFLDAGRDRLRHHLEVSELHPARRQQPRRVLLDRGDSEARSQAEV